MPKCDEGKSAHTQDFLPEDKVWTLWAVLKILDKRVDTPPKKLGFHVRFLIDQLNKYQVVQTSCTYSMIQDLLLKLSDQDYFSLDKDRFSMTNKGREHLYFLERDLRESCPQKYVVALNLANDVETIESESTKTMSFLVSQLLDEGQLAYVNPALEMGDGSYKIPRTLLAKNADEILEYISSKTDIQNSRETLNEMDRCDRGDVEDLIRKVIEQKMQKEDEKGSYCWPIGFLDLERGVVLRDQSDQTTTARNIAIAKFNSNFNKKGTDDRIILVDVSDLEIEDIYDLRVSLFGTPALVLGKKNRANNYPEILPHRDEEIQAVHAYFIMEAPPRYKRGEIIRTGELEEIVWKSLSWSARDLQPFLNNEGRGRYTQFLKLVKEPIRTEVKIERLSNFIGHFEHRRGGFVQDPPKILNNGWIDCKNGIALALYFMITHFPELQGHAITLFLINTGRTMDLLKDEGDHVYATIEANGKLVLLDPTNVIMDERLKAIVICRYPLLIPVFEGECHN